MYGIYINMTWSHNLLPPNPDGPSFIISHYYFLLTGTLSLSSSASHSTKRIDLNFPLIPPLLDIPSPEFPGILPFFVLSQNLFLTLSYPWNSQSAAGPELSLILDYSLWLALTSSWLLDYSPFISSCDEKAVPGLLSTTCSDLRLSWDCCLVFFASSNLNLSLDCS